MKTNNLVNVIDDTIECIKIGDYEEKSWDGEVHDLKDGIKKMVSESRVYNSISTLDPNQNPEIEETIVTVENKDTFDKASEPGWKLNCICLNMASEFQPGGGVLKGSKAQEEDLCRRSTLLRSLYMFAPDDFKEIFDLKLNGMSNYPLKRYGAIWSPYVEVFKDKDYEYLSSPFKTNVISFAGLRFPRFKEDGDLIPEHRKIIKEKMRSLLRLAGKMEKRKLVLGAWGCGAFKNPPKFVAKMFKRVIGEEEFKGWFSDICFAIIDNPQRKETNYKVFKEIMERDEI